MSGEEAILTCASGPDKCLQPWAHLSPSFTCNRCDRAIHPSCAAIDASEALSGHIHNPESIRICHDCLLPGESPNRLGLFSSDTAQPAKKKKTAGSPEEEQPILADATGENEELKGVADVDWETLQRPHSSFKDLVASTKVCAPDGSKKTIWWRLYHTWNMVQFGDEVEQPLAYCNLCGKIVKLHRVDRSPTPLKRHLQLFHKQFFDIMLAQKLKDGPLNAHRADNSKPEGLFSPERTGKRGANRMGQLKAITQWILETDQPLEVVESESFRRMCAVIANHTTRHYNTFDKEVVVEHIHFLSSSMRDKMKEILSNQSLVHVQEYWMTLGRCSYHVDRVHWIDSHFGLRSLAIACNVLDPALATGHAMRSVWETLGVLVEKQVSVTVTSWNNADTIDRVGGPFVFRGVESELNGIAEIAFTALGPNTRAVVDKTRAFVETFNSSSAKNDLLLKAQQALTSFYQGDHTPLPLLPDSVSLWWSTNEMIGRLIYLRKALEYLALNERFVADLELPTKQEWDILETLHQAWEPFSIASQLLQKQRFVTVGLIPMIFQIIGEDLSNCDPGKLKTCISTMHSAWLERYGADFPSEPFRGVPTVIWIAHALDPRFKSLDILGSTQSSKDVIFEAILEEMVALRMQDKESEADDAGASQAGDSGAKSTPQSQSLGTSAVRTFASSRLSGSKRGLDRLSERFSPATKKSSKATSDASGLSRVKDQCKAELKAYQDSDGLALWTEHDDGSKEFVDPLPWWKDHHKDFPTLWKIARKYLAIPATCAAAERAFDPDAHAELAKRCHLQATATEEMKLLKENAFLVHDFNEEPDAYKNESKKDDTGTKTRSEDNEDDDNTELGEAESHVVE